MRALRLVLVVLAAAVVGVAYWTTRDDGGSPAGSAVAPSDDAVQIQFAYSSNLEDMMATLLPRFNGEQVKVDGRPVFVQGLPASSGDVQQKIVRGELKPHAWSPASSLWGRLLNHEMDRKFVADDNRSLATSPVVLAMWEPLARALGWPRKEIGFADVLELATTKSDWGDYGKPTFGKFKLGHTNPDFSTSGLSFVAAQYYTAAGKREGLTIEDIARPEIRRKVRAIEQSIVHYGDTGSFFAEQLAIHGPGYASAVAMEETTLLEFNEERKPGQMKLVAIYPAEGTYMSDNPFLPLDASWVSPVQRKAVEALGAWLEQQMTPSLVARFRYRPGDPDVRPLAPVVRANGVDPDKPTRLLDLPESTVLARIKSAWHEDRKAANVLLVVDVSGSMNEEGRIDQARLGLKSFLSHFLPRDRVGLLTFSDDSRVIVPVGLFDPIHRNTLSGRISELVADGGTALYDATLEGWDLVDGLADDQRINAVVVLSDGADTGSATSLETLVAQLEARSESDDRQIRVFTIAYGSDATAGVLEKIAAAAGGESYTGDPETIEEVYLRISSYF